MLISPAKKTASYTPTMFLFLACCLLVIASSSHSSTPLETEEELYGQCKRAYTEGKFTDASQYIEKFLSLYPESDHADEILFIHAFLQPAIDTSIEIYRLVIERYPNSKWAAKAHFQLGQCYYLQGNYDRALDHYGKIIVSYPEDEIYWSARYWKCRSLIAKGNYEEAVAALRSLEDGNSTEIVGLGGEKPSSDMILMSLGDCYLGMRDYESAVVLYRSLIESMPHSQRVASAYLLLAKSLQNLGKLEEAKTFYQKVIQDYHQSVEAQQAQQYLDALLLTQPKDPDTPHTMPEAVGTTHASPVETTSYFSIQVGAFSEKRRAGNLADQLRKKGYSVNIVFPVPGGSHLYKVRVGNFKTRSAALEAAQKLHENEKLDTAVVP